MSIHPCLGVIDRAQDYVLAALGLDERLESFLVRTLASGRSLDLDCDEASVVDADKVGAAGVGHSKLDRVAADLGGAAVVPPQHETRHGAECEADLILELGLSHGPTVMLWSAC